MRLLMRSMHTDHSAIIGFGMYIPRLRIRTAEIARHWHVDPATIASGIGVEEKTVPDRGEDAYTMACEAAQQAMEIARMDRMEISAVFVGSESHPYAVKPTSSMVASAIGAHPFCHCADLEFACKAGTAGMQIVDAFIRSGQIRFGLAIGSDTAQAAPGDALEYTAAAGAAAMLLGPAGDERALCRVDATLSFTTDTPDFWRPAGEAYPRHAGRFTGEPGYFRHVREALQGILSVGSASLDDIHHVVLHMPNAKFPERIAQEFGIRKEQMERGFIVPRTGNTYSACALLGLAHVLQSAQAGERIIVVSYGSGAGADAFLLTMLRDGVRLPTHHRQTEYVDYGRYLQHIHAPAPIHT